MCLYVWFSMFLQPVRVMRRALSEPTSSEATINTLSTKGSYKKTLRSTWMLESLQTSTVNTGKSRQALPAGYPLG